MVKGKVPFEAVKGVSPPALAVLHAQGFRHATPVQAAVIPLFSGHKDVAVDAATGSGKTLAFVLPLVEKLRGRDEPLQPQQVGAVIVSPTRELAKQIHAVAAPFLATLPGVSSLLLVGGTDPAEDVAQFRQEGGQVLIGTPGRLSDFMKRCTALDARRLEVLVLDEADRLLDMGFREQLDAIMSRLPRQRRTGLFSATQTEAVGALARAGLRNPVRVNVAVTQPAAPAAATGHSGSGGGGGGGGSHSEPTEADGVVPAAAAGGGQRTPSSLDIAYLVCASTEKLGQLVAFLQAHSDEKSIVYFLTCACVDLVASLLARLPNKIQLPPVCALHGRMKQAAREATLASFAALPAGCLLATDVAARGLDIPDVGWVLQFDAPQEPDAFVHRCGRTARMGRRGSALAFLLPHEASYVDFLRLRRVPMREVDPFPQPDLQLAHIPRQAAEADREVLEKGVRAFVSYVRGYKEHQCRFIFRLADLDLGQLAMAMGLLRVPRMPEIKHASVALRNFTPSAIDPDTVKFADKAREKQRQKALTAKAKAAAAQDAARQQDSGSRKQQQKAAAEVERKHLPAAKRRLIESLADADDMSGDYALLRKVKKGKITEEDYDLATGLTEDAAARAEQRPKQHAAERPNRKQNTKKAKKAAKRRAKG